MLGTRLTGPRPAPLEPLDWLLRAPVFTEHCRLVRFSGKGRTSRSRGRAGTRMCVVAAAEELQRGAERPMDEEDAAAPVGGDRRRGPGGPGLCRSRGGGPGRRLRARGGARGSDHGRSSRLTPSPLQPGPVTTGRSLIDRLRPGGPGCHLRDPPVLRRRGPDPVLRQLLGAEAVRFSKVRCLPV